MEAVHQCSAQGLQFTPGEHSPEHQECWEETVLAGADVQKRTSLLNELCTQTPQRVCSPKAVERFVNSGIFIILVIVVILVVTCRVGVFSDL